MALDAQGRVLVADGYNRRIRRVTSEGETTTIGGGADGPRIEGAPHGIMVAKDGTMIVSVRDGPHRISTLSADGTLTTLAGSAEVDFVDGRGEAARFNCPVGMAEGPDGRIYVADFSNHSIRRVDRQGNVTTVAGGGPTAAGHIDGDLAVARFNGPTSVAVASDGTIYVGEAEGKCVRMIHEGMVTTLHRCEGEVWGLLLDEPNGILYVSFDHGILTITVPTPAERREARYYLSLIHI